MMVFLFFAQASVGGFWNAEEQSFAPYRSCMLSQASELANANGEISALEAAARSVCRAELATVTADVALNAAQIAIDESDGHPSLHDPNGHLELMQRELTEDFAATVLKARTHASN
jgi:hypothetical protein